MNIRVFAAQIVPIRRPGITSGLLIWLLSLMLWGGTAQAEDFLDRQITINILANTPLEDALIDWGIAAGFTVMINTETVHGRVSPEVRGHVTARTALISLLKDSGLSYIESEKRIRVVPTSTLVHSRLTEDNNGEPDARSWATNSDFPALDQGNIDDVSANGSGLTDVRNGINEVIVTAEKRDERLQDVAVPVTVVSGESLVNTDRTLIQDYFSSIPGLSLSPATESAQILVIRGITTGGGSASPTVGITIDDVPFGASQGGVGFIVPDLDPGDVARIEVLRGPQGTLYGVSSMGGLVKYVTVEPSTERVSGSVQAGSSTIYNGAELGYTFRGSINVPISDTFAVRASAFTRRDPGYIDNPVLHIDGVNEDKANGGLLSALWRPAADISLKISALAQQIKGDGVSDVVVAPGLQGLQQNYIPGAGGYDRTVQQYSATFKARIGSMDLISLTGFNSNRANSSLDESSAVGQYYILPQFGVSGAQNVGHESAQKFSQEVRLSGSLWSQTEWLVGGFYTHEHIPVTLSILGENPQSGAIAGTFATFDTPDTSTQEYAVFANLTQHFTDQFDVQLGGRGSDITVSPGNETVTGFGAEAFYLKPSPYLIPGGSSTEHPFTFLITPRYKLSPDLMIYTRVASGYRAGGPNTNFGVPPEYHSDSIRDYEIGTKGSVFDHTLSFDLSLYYIDWKKIQIQLDIPNTYVGYLANGGSAKSEGAELSLEWRPLRGLSVAAWGSYDDAVLTQNLPSAALFTYGLTGFRLPFTSKVTGSFSMRQEFPLVDTLNGFVGATTTFVGDRLGNFSTFSTVPRDFYPSYWKTDLLGGATWGPWTANLYANNVANRRGLIGGGSSYFPTNAYLYIQPRTVGLSLRRTF